MNRLYRKFKQTSSILPVFIALAALLCPDVFASAKVSADPSFSLQESFYGQINAPAAWDYTVGDSNVVVAVIDVGVDIGSEDLKENIWKNEKEIPGNGLDDDGNGFVDDIYGWNFVENDSDVGISVIKEVDDSSAVSHGTILAGLIGAVGDNNILGAGLNWRVKIMALRAISSSGGGSFGDVAKAITYAVNNGADIISISFVGEQNSNNLQQSLRLAHQKGVLVVAASGNNRNDGTGNDNLSKNQQYPICSTFPDLEDWVLGVTSVDKNDKLSDFTNFGTCVDISAPGEYIFSTQRYAPQYGYNKNFDGPWFGSSFSAPLVAGAAALVKSVRPDWKAKEIIANLLATADDVDVLNPGYVGQMGYGRLNVGRAVARAVESKNIPTVVFTGKLIRKQAKYFAQILADGKVLRDFPLVNYSAKSAKWLVKEDMLVYARLSKNKIIVEGWDLSNDKKLPNMVLDGFSGLVDLNIGRVWGDGPNVILSVKKGKITQKIIIDIPSASWKVE